MVKRALLIAFHFPPIRQSSGIQRTLKFATYLRDHAWQPLVLSAHPRVYRVTGDDQMDEIPEDVPVVRAFALDTSRHLAIAGRYPDLLARPDRYAFWLPGGVWSGLRLVRRHRPAVLWSTYPVATAHLIGLWLHRLTGLPWVADFRDSMTEENYPRDPAMRARFRRIEARTVRAADRVVFTTPSARAMYADRYPDVPENRWCVIPNGYDEENFVDAESIASPARKTDGGPLRLVHAGALYPNERDPSAFFDALRALKQRGVIDSARFRILLRASGYDRRYRTVLEEADIADIVELAPPLPYRETLAEMLESDGLLLFQSAGCNHQIPAKLYEYLRAGRPVLALTDRAGDTAATLLDAGIDTILPLDDAAAIESGLPEFLDALRRGSAPVASREVARQYSRAAGAAELARLFDGISA